MQEKTKKTLALGELPPDGLPRLVLLQTRNEEGAQKLIDKVSYIFITTPYILFWWSKWRFKFRSFFTCIHTLHYFGSLVLDYLQLINYISEKQHGFL